MEMKKIVKQDVQKVLTSYENTPVYLHVEITSGMYASHLDGNVFNAGTFLRNIQVEFIHATIRGGNRSKEHRVGLKLANGGWVYVLGLTHYIEGENGEFIMHGFNTEGKLASALEISTQPFFK